MMLLTAWQHALDLAFKTTQWCKACSAGAAYLNSSLCINRSLRLIELQIFLRQKKDSDEKYIFT